MERTKIAVLGSGAGALGAVWEITESPGWQDRFEIDVYAMGWRLGGKAASGRNADYRYRNEEHGLHILGGFYHNCFQQLRPLYAAWNAHDEDLPLHFDEAFFPYGRFSIMQREPGAAMRETRFDIAGDERVPGVDPEDVTPTMIIRRLLSWARLGFTAMKEGSDPFGGGLVGKASLRPAGFAKFQSIELGTLAATLVAAEAAAAELGKSDKDALIAEEAVIDAASNALQWIISKDDGLVPVENADWLGLAGLAMVIVRGLVRDRVFATGFQAIDKYDAREWLSRHGASERVLRNGNYMAGYSYAFAFTDGDPLQKSFAAGTALRAYFRMLFASHGNLFYHMNGGMGEVFVLPYYDVLRRRGVRFHFFHKVTALRPDDFGSLGSIEFQIQARPKGEYDPVIRYRPDAQATERRCWPTEPLWDTLENGDELRAANLDFEAFYGPVPPGSHAKRLDAGVDFDLCILAIPPGMLRIIARPLADANEAWEKMLATAGTTPTLAAQCWRQERVDSFDGLSERGLMTAHELPLDTWADMSFLLPLEQADAADERAGSLSYFCGAVPLAKADFADDEPADERQRAAQLVEQWMQLHLSDIFPGLRRDDDGLEPDRERMTVINSDPAKLYVTSPAGSTDARLAPDGSGFANLFLAGDWTKHNFDCGAVESAIMSARICARAICGYPRTIYGETDRN
ncbi:FAD-dependent oxidoreductase [Sphingopyxis sp. EG6]|uniref:FAD-dependent oxidoreductase n=1 Tax=Sphingopyxis sp. EG6 TaxID=1874061 RepID=UPI000DC63CA3|nr:FAD-dependent oxidoreductase [Sphingopyxis sp. EG6]BBB10386.1 cytoplasmic membrane protein [Sphingopyxis sp. EG6]